MIFCCEQANKDGRDRHTAARRVIRGLNVEHSCHGAECGFEQRHCRCGQRRAPAALTADVCVRETGEAGARRCVTARQHTPHVRPYTQRTTPLARLFTGRRHGVATYAGSRNQCSHHHKRHMGDKVSAWRDAASPLPPRRACVHCSPPHRCHTLLRRHRSANTFSEEPLASFLVTFRMSTSLLEAGNSIASV